jgi:hypothetical protein
MSVTHQPADQTAEINDHELDADSCMLQYHATRIRQSKMARKKAKANNTRKINELTVLISDVENLERVHCRNA